MKLNPNWLLPALFVCAVVQAGEPVAIVTDVTGPAQRGEAAVEILSELESGDIVHVADGTRLHMVYYYDGREFVYSGPARFEVGNSNPITLSGMEPNSQSVLPDGEGAVSTVGLAQAAVVMRAAPNGSVLTLREPVETLLLSPPEKFVWDELEAGVGYAFELTDSEGRSLLESIVTGGSVALPDQIQLQPGQDYTWSVETRLPDGRKFSSYAGFTVADEAFVEEVERSRPQDNAPLSELIVFALWLEANDLQVEASRYWRRASDLRPQDAGLKQKAGRS